VRQRSSMRESARMHPGCPHARHRPAPPMLTATASRARTCSTLVCVPLAVAALALPPPALEHGNESPLYWAPLHPHPWGQHSKTRACVQHPVCASPRNHLRRPRAWQGIPLPRLGSDNTPHFGGKTARGARACSTLGLRVHAAPTCPALDHSQDRPLPLLGSFTPPPLGATTARRVRACSPPGLSVTPHPCVSPRAHLPRPRAWQESPCLDWAPTTPHPWGNNLQRRARISRLVLHPWGQQP
jgi:hypothetical protein